MGLGSWNLTGYVFPPLPVFTVGGLSTGSRKPTKSYMMMILVVARAIVPLESFASSVIVFWPGLHPAAGGVASRLAPVPRNVLVPKPPMAPGVMNQLRLVPVSSPFSASFPEPLSGKRQARQN